MSSLWDDIKKTVKDGVNVAANKTEELSKIGKVKVDIYKLNQSVEKSINQLGMEVYEQLSPGKKAKIDLSASIQELVKTIGGLKESLKQKEEEIEKIKAEADAKKAGGKTDSPVESKARK